MEDPYCKLYFTSAQKYKTLRENVNMSIKNAKVKAFEEGSKQPLLEELFKDFSKIPTNKDFLSILVEYVEGKISM